VIAGSVTVPIDGEPAFAGPPLVVHAVAGLAGAEVVFVVDVLFDAHATNSRAETRRSRMDSPDCKRYA
jgi:hypothetical protein